LQSARSDVWDFFTGPTEFKQVIPQVFFSAPRGVQLEVIAGLMDSDGCCEEGKYGGSWRYKVVFSNSKLEIVKGLAGLMRLCGCRIGVLKSNIEYTGKPQYRISPNIYDFAQNCYFRCKRKQERLERFKELRCASETSSTAPSRG
jgi:intein/homing endonuclease